MPDLTFIAKLPPDVLAQIPGELPPAGVTPNFLHPVTTLPQIAAVCSVFLGLSLLCYGLRMYNKALIARKCSWDDLTISIGFFLAIAIYGFFLNGCVNGATSRHAWDVRLDRELGRANLLQNYWTVVLSQPSLALIKGSLFLQYYSIFQPLRWLRIAVWVGGIAHCIMYTAIIILAFALASPRRGESWLVTTLSSHYQSTTKISIPLGAIGLLVDLYLFILPIPAIVKLQVTPARKIALVVIFTTGGLALAASALAFAYRIKLQIDGSDVTWKVAFLLMFNQVEMFAGVMVSCMPAVKGFSSHFQEAFRGKSLFSSLSKTSLASILRKSSTQETEHKTKGASVTTFYASSQHDASKIRVVRDYTVEREP